jgi:transposase
MYLRHSTVRKNGKTHTYWRLVKSVRNGAKVRQQTVAQLGELDAQGRASAKKLAELITGGRAQPGLFDEPETDATASVDVVLGGVRLERSRRFGDVFLGWTLWRALHFDALLAELMPRGREDVAWSTVAALHVITRLCSPSSDLHIVEDFYRKTALADLLDLPEHKVNDDRIYRALDHLLAHKEAIETHLRARIGELFNVEYDLLLYDITSTYFEGQCLGNPMAKRGYSRDHRPDCKQVTIALVVTREGIPLSHEVFDGNRADVTTVEEIVGSIEKRWGTADRVWVMDRGMASEHNLEWLREGGRKYLIGANKAEMRRFEQQLVEEKDWRKIRDDVEVKLCASPDGIETFILCRSATRQAKDRAIVERFERQLKNSLESLQRRLQNSRRPLDRDDVQRQIGRILERTSRAAGKYSVRVESTSEHASGLKLVIDENKQWSEWLRRKEGCYLLRSNVSGWSDEQLWRTYIQLCQAEAAFRIEKSELSIRPVWHHRADRVKAHIFVCFLAYALWKTLEQWQQRAGLGNGPRTILEELGHIQSAEVVLPTVDGRELRLRCVVRPEPSQLFLLERMGLQLPRRLKPPKLIAGA